MAALKEQFENLRQRLSRPDDMEMALDAEIRRRFGLMISRAIGAAKGTLS
jgi:hypothetical protein